MLANQALLKHVLVVFTYCVTVFFISYIFPTYFLPFPLQYVESAQLGSQQSRGEFPDIMLEYGNEPLQYDIYTTIGR